MIKSWKTTLIGIIGLLFLLIGLVLVSTKIITFGELVQSLSIVATFLGALVAIFAKDSNITGGTKK